MHALWHDNETSVISVKNSTESWTYYIFTGLFIQYISVILLIFRHQHEEHKTDAPSSASIHRILLEHPCFGFRQIGCIQTSFVTQHTSDYYCHLIIFISVVITKLYSVSK